MSVAPELAVDVLVVDRSGSTHVPRDTLLADRVSLVLPTARTGTVHLGRKDAAVDEMTLDTRSSKTTRVRGKSPEG